MTDLHEQGFPVAPLCQSLGVSRSGYYAWKRSRRGRRSEEDRRLISEVRAVFQEHKRRYGARRISRELSKRGTPCGTRRVSRLMREMGLEAIQPRSFRPRTTQSRHRLGYSPNLLADGHLPSAVKRVWVGDITYVPLVERGFVYLALLMDLYSRRIVDWELDGNMKESLVLSTLHFAIAGRQPGPGLIHHTDRGGQYAGNEYRRILERARDIASPEWLALMLDGIRLSKDQLAVVALGIAADGTKQILDFELGSSENFEVCRDLVSRLVSRRFEPKHGLLAVLDGADALRKAVLTFFADAVIQRCVIHKDRNIRGRLSKRHWGTLTRLFKRLREVEAENAVREAYLGIERFLTDKNAAALESLREAGEELIALHRLNVPSTLHVSLLSTNLIENSFRNTRRKLGRVTRFRAETDQASRWLAAALLEAEKSFRRLIGYKDLPRLGEALARHKADREASCHGLSEHCVGAPACRDVGWCVAYAPPNEDLNPYLKRLTITPYTETISGSTTRGTSPVRLSFVC